MAKEPLADFLNYLVTNFKSKKATVTNNDNIIIGDTVNLVMKDSTFFPRLELLIKKLKYDGFVDQRTIAQSFRFTVVGHIRRDSDDTVAQDMYDIINFARETQKIIYQSHDDRAAGVTICDGFMQISGFTEIFIDYELFPRVSSFVLEGEAEIQLSDTFTNN